MLRKHDEHLTETCGVNVVIQGELDVHWVNWPFMGDWDPRLQLNKTAAEVAQADSEVNPKTGGRLGGPGWPTFK